MNLELLRRFAATPRQLEILEAVIETGSKSAAANKLNINRTTVIRSIDGIIKRAATMGFSPQHNMMHDVPDPFVVKGISTLYDMDGTPVQQWVKSSLDKDKQLDAVYTAAKALAETIPSAKPITPPPHSTDDLLNVFILTDYHLGMKAWGEETGEDWDIDIAEKLLIDWFSTAISLAPQTNHAVFAQMGDFLHWDGLDAVTPTGNNLLDADTRFQKIVRVGIRVLRKVIDMLLEKHRHVHVIMAEGNHDIASSVWLREMFASLYAEEPRITVDQNADIYYCYEFGDTSLFFHHGHKKRINSVDDVFVAKYREIFGRTRHSYAHLGHLHNSAVKESNLMVVEQHRTLASSDAYASRGGWCSGRDAKVITYHRKHGKVGEIVVSPDMVAT